MAKSKAKSKGTGRANRKSVSKAKSLPKAGTKAQGSARKAKSAASKFERGERKSKAPKRVAGKRRNAKTGSKKSALANKKSAVTTGGQSASQLIDQRIRELGDWRGQTLARMRTLILEAEPQMVEEWKWRGTPVWSHGWIVCTGESYTKVVKLTFAHGASIPDPTGLFNSSLDGNTRRAIDIHEGVTVNADAFKTLVKAAVARNGASAKKARAKTADAQAAKPKKVGVKESKRKNVSEGGKGEIVRLAGGNPQSAKADGDAPVQTYIAAMPGWKHELGRRLDALITRHVPNVRKAVKWNSPFYGMEGQGWFLSFHVFTHYVKVTFFRGMSLNPVPPGVSTQPEVRYIDIRESDPLDEAQMEAWVTQAAALPGWLA